MALARSHFAPRVLVLAVALVLLAFGGNAIAATIDVTRTDDPPVGTGDTCDPTASARDCSLRHALNQALNGDTVHVPGNANHYVLDSSQGALTPSNNIFIAGDGAKSSIIDAQNSTIRVFDLHGDDTVIMRDLTITGGHVTGANGGGILVTGSTSLGLTRVAVTGNTTNFTGGGIAFQNNGGKALSIDHSEISGNSASQGGGVYLSGQGTGSPSVGPGVSTRFGVATTPNATIVDTTIASNDAAFNGGGIEASAPTESTFEVVDLLNDTIARNTTEFSPNQIRSVHAAIGSGPAGAGIAGFNTSVQSANTILALNTDPQNGNSSDNCSGTTMSSQDYNLADDGTCQFTGAHDRVVSDAKLGTLANNGGQTRTIALLEGSPAIDGSDSNNCPADDQRGVSRPQRAACDTGAFELESSADVSLTKTVSPSSVTVGQNVTFTLTSLNAGPSDATNTVVTDTLPAGVAFVSGSASQGSCTGTTSITCHLGTVAAGAHATITIVARVTNAGQFVNSANVTADPADPNSANNHASATVIGVNPAAPSCVDTRRFSFKLHKWHKTRIVDAVVFINNKKAAHKKGHNLRSITIAKLPQQVFKVKIVSTQATGSKLISTRTYNGCIKSRPKTIGFHVHPHHHHHH